MSRRVQRPPIHGRGYSVRELVSVGGGSGASVNCWPRPPAAPSPRPPPSPPARPEPACPEPVDRAEGRAVARCCSIGAATRALATSVSRPIWLCHQPLHAIAPCQKFV